MLILGALATAPVAAQTSTHAETAPPPQRESQRESDRESDRESLRLVDEAWITPADGTVGTVRTEQDRSADRTGGSTFLRDVGGDFTRFFSTDDTLWTMGTMGVGALFVSSWDGSNARSIRDNWSDEAFGPGHVAGNFLTHMALGGGTYLVGRVSGQDRAARLGTDVMRAQILSQSIVQGVKFATQRDRPDRSNQHSLPSGHAATSFATAGVLHRHFGWKAGIPAYAVASYIGASRMASNRHYLSDVVLGAGIGIAAAYTVTVGVGSETFAVGVAPAGGGAAVTFTKR